MDLSTDNPFADLMAKAAKLKSAQQAQLRTQFDSWPQYFQHSLFMQESVVTARSKPYPERIAAAENMKALGNSYFKKHEFKEAVAEFEKALAVFKYLEDKDPGWKKKGIEDGDMILTDFKCDNSNDQNRLESLKVACYLNIAAAKFKLKEYPICICACDDTLEIEPKSVKALYRRALALITPASSGATEFDRALLDLRKAYAIDEENQDVRRLLRELIKQRAKQRVIDRETFSGMFDRGQVYDEKSAKQDAGMDESTLKQKYQREVLVDHAEDFARGFEAKGQTEYAQEIRKSIDRSQKIRDRRLNCVDFYNPTAEMIADAEKNGIDLTDRKVQQMLHDLQEEERHKRSFSDLRFETAQKPSSSVESVESILESMTSTEISLLLKREGIDYGKITDREHFIETARQVFQAKLNKRKPTKSSHTRTIIFVAIAWTLLRLYTSGGLSLFSQITMNAIFGIGQTRGVTPAAKDMDMFDED
ncbi:putative tetratricopeptide-like helical domain superfamily [Plasmopara halstedii]